MVTKALYVRSGNVCDRPSVTRSNARSTHTHTQVPAADASSTEIRLDVRAICAVDDFLSLRSVTPLALHCLEMRVNVKRQTIIYRDAEYRHTDVPRQFQLSLSTNSSQRDAQLYHRDSARRRSLRRSRSLKAIDVGTSQKPVCDFLLVNRTNTNLHPISHRFSVIAQY